MKKNCKIEKFLFSKLAKKNPRYKEFDKNTNFFRSGIDSLDYLTLIFEIEKKFKIKINNNKYINLNTFDKLKQEIVKKRKTKFDNTKKY